MRTRRLSRAAWLRVAAGAAVALLGLGFVGSAYAEEDPAAPPPPSPAVVEIKPLPGSDKLTPQDAINRSKRYERMEKVADYEWT